MELSLLVWLLMIAIWKVVISCTMYQDPACTYLNPLHGDYYLNEWVIKIDGNRRDAERIARDVGLQYLTPVLDIVINVRLILKKKILPSFRGFIFDRLRSTTITTK